jgi:hypothetical protein
MRISSFPCQAASPLALAEPNTQLITQPCLKLQLLIIQRLTIVAPSHDQHAGPQPIHHLHVLLVRMIYLWEVLAEAQVSARANRVTTTAQRVPTQGASA